LSNNNNNNALIEGEGVFKDYNGSEDGRPVFETTNPDEWLQYCKDKGLTRSGSAPCIVCNTVFSFENLAVGKNPVCESCKGDLV
jgi:hypothetical protein